MTYKNRDKQRNAVKMAARRRRAKQKALIAEAQGAIPEVVPLADKVLKDCSCRHCVINRERFIINHGAYKPAHELADNEVNRIVFPGDADYVEVAI